MKHAKNSKLQPSNAQMGTLPLATAGERVVHEHFQPDMRLSAATWPFLQVPQFGQIGVKSCVFTSQEPVCNGLFRGK
jgi:hypothetical protein